MHCCIFIDSKTHQQYHSKKLITIHMADFILNPVNNSERVKYLLNIIFIVFGIASDITSLAEAPYILTTVTGIISLGAFAGATALFRQRPGLSEEDA